MGRNLPISWATRHGIATPKRPNLPRNERNSSHEASKFTAVCQRIFHESYENRRHVHKTLEVALLKRAWPHYPRYSGKSVPNISLHFCFADHSLFGSAISCSVASSA